MNNNRQKLPEGWAITTMGEVSEVIGGGTPSSKVSDNFDEKSGYPWITPADLSNFTDIYIKRGRRFLTEKGLNSCSARLVPAGSVLLSSRAPIGYVAIAANELCTNQGFKSFVCHEGLESEFIYYWLLYKRQELQQMGSGSTFAELSGARAKQIPLAISPTREQTIISEVLKKLFARVNITKDRLETTAKTMKRFRKSILNAACTGKLTEDWREKQPASKCTRTSSENNLLTEIEGFNFEIPKNWTIVSAEYVCNKITDGAHKTPKRRKEGRILLSAKNIRSGYIDYENHDLISEDDFNRCLLRCNPEPGDVLIVSVGATIGRCAIVEKDTKFAIVRSVGLFKPNDLIRGKLLMYILQSPLLQKVIESVSQGTAQLCLYINKMKKLPIPLPPLEEQQKTVRRVDRLFEFADNVEERITEARERVVKLTQSILSKAFRGELVPTEAELAHKEGRDYETAKQLLARIKAEREKQPKLRIKVKRRTMKEKPSEKEAPLPKSEENRLLEILLKTKDKKLTPEQFLKRAGFDEGSIDDFYEELRAAVQAGQIKESRPKKTEIYLEATKP